MVLVGGQGRTYILIDRIVNNNLLDYNILQEQRCMNDHWKKADN